MLFVQKRSGFTRLMLLLAVFTLPVQAAPFVPDLKALQQVLQAKAQQPATAVALLAQGNQLLWSYGYHPQQTLTGQHQLVIASISKQMTAALVLQAVAQERLSLDAPVAHVLTKDAARLGTITTRQLLNHTSGVGTAGAKPGQNFHYSNEGYQLLAQVLESIYAEPYAAQAARLFQRCQMSASFAPTTAIPVSSAVKLVTGQALVNGQWRAVNPDAFALQNVPAGGIVSSAADLIRWQQCLYKTDLLPEFQRMQLVASGSKRNNHRWGEVFYGLGIQILKQDQLLEWSHGGYLPGYMLTLLYYPQFDLSLVVWQPQSGDGKNPAQDLALQDKLRAVLRAQLISANTNKAQTSAGAL
ncbi:serine hydrolase [Rheinheimera sp. 4Y26]|uniref:serine hydrolase domain-containing protein n=1 Tax=Rheinheimera sp. 4Y26 TaxID=2977811 RepID=UPI0021B12C7A|nr:serine hydrolase [Rheinheimera sp. 4Y26]MCT6698337.1 beta-lactamase family protein [Rheinheimera sp. 4Y26]